jgi:hypothetical protein
VNGPAFSATGKNFTTPEAVAKWINSGAGIENHVVLRMADGRFMTAARNGTGEEWHIERENDSIPLNQFISGPNDIPSELGVIRFTWRSDLRQILPYLRTALELEAALDADQSSKDWADEIVKEIRDSALLRDMSDCTDIKSDENNDLLEDDGFDLTEFQYLAERYAL